MNVWTPYLSLDLPHVNEILAQLGGQEVLSAEKGERPGRTVPSPVRQEAGTTVEVEHGQVPQLRTGIRAQNHLKRSRHLTIHYSLKVPSFSSARSMMGYVGM